MNVEITIKRIDWLFSFIWCRVANRLRCHCL